MQKPEPKVHRVPVGTMPVAPVTYFAIDPNSSYSKQVKRKLARTRRARICWNTRSF